MAHVPRVLLVTGAYHPEISSGGQQCRDVARALDGAVNFSVLTTAVDRSLPAEERVDQVPVYRLPIDVQSTRSRLAATWRLARLMRRLRRQLDIVHIHGVSSKNVPVTLLARAMGLRVVLTMHTAGQDEPAAVARRGGLSRWAFRVVDRVLSVSPVLTERYLEAGLPQDRLRSTINGIDTQRFHPVGGETRRALRSALGLPDVPMVLFVGFFSRDKRPDLLFEAWLPLARTERVTLVYVGATRSPYFEVDTTLAERMRSDAQQEQLSDCLRLVEPTQQIERYFQAADLFVLPSVREAMPLALLEAMACGLPVIASRIAGATDVIVDDGVSGLLVAPDDAKALTAAMRRVLEDRQFAHALGQQARVSVEKRFSIARAAQDWLTAYREVLVA